MLRTPARVLAAAAMLLVAATGLTPVASAHPVHSDSSATTLPTDPEARGYIGFCDEAGHNVVGGDIDTKPFVWKAVASTRPPAAFQGKGQNAVLNAYQPRPDTRPSEWSGSALTAASFYAAKDRPTVQATYIDSSLGEFRSTFPPKVNGLYVLRVYWGKRNYGLYSASYPTTTIQVQGSRWHVVSGGTVDCGSGAKAISMEQLTGVVSKKDVTPRAPVADQSTTPSGSPRRIATAPSAAGKQQGDVAAGRHPGAGDASTGPGRADASASNTSTGSSWVLWSLVGAVALLALTLVLVTRRRSNLSPDTKDRP